MKKFRTELILSPDSAPISMADRVMTIGSCFSDSIGAQLKAHKFSVLTNPGGVIFHPPGIHKMMDYIITRNYPQENGYVENSGIWSHFDFHSSLSGMTLIEAQLKINTAIDNAHHFLKGAHLLILTYGTAFVYELNSSGEMVANCHKIPGTLYRKRLLTVDEITTSFQNLYAALKKEYPQLRIILTASPVRHLKDSIELNSVSKSMIRLAIHEIKERFDIEYFPAYEIMMDDLRDYRFYAADMMHPSAEAIDYIWEKFSDRYFDMSTKDFTRRWQALANSIHHTPFHPHTPAHQKFLRNLILQLQEFSTVVDVSNEIAIVQSQIADNINA